MINLPAHIKKDLQDIDAVAKELQMKLYVVGGFPRDLVSGTGISDDTDLDVTEANGNAFDLAFFVSAKYNLPEPVVYEYSGTALVTMPSGRPVEFHNAFHNVSHIIDQLYALGIKPTPLNKDIYSRDFTINTLLFDPDTGEIIDVTGKGINDIENKILRVPINPKKTLARSPKNILRGIRFAVQMGLTVDEEYEREVANFLPGLKVWMQANPNSEMVNRTVKKTVEANPELAFEMYDKYGLTEYLPSIPEINSHIKKSLFGIEISPVASMREAQTRMMDHLMKEREKHKAYMRRKKREQTQQTKEKFKILERAREGFYLDNPEPEFLKKKKVDKKNKILNYIRSEEDPAVAGRKNWLKMAQEESGLEGEGSGNAAAVVRDIDVALDDSFEDAEGGQANPLTAFLQSFMEVSGVDEMTVQQIYKYVKSAEFFNDVKQVVNDSDAIVAVLENAMTSLPIGNQRAIAELKDVRDIFSNNALLMTQLLNHSYEDSNGNEVAFIDVAGPQGVTEEAPVAQAADTKYELQKV